LKFIDLEKQYKSLEAEIDRAVKSVMDSGQYILGPNVEGLENELADYIGVDYGVGVASGTDALVLSLRALDIGTGDEVITTPFTFVATAEAIISVGANPVFIDIEPDTFNINPRLIKDAITPRTKAIIPVHLFGLSASIEEICQIANEYVIHVIEDNAQALGATYSGRKTGSFGIASAVSFFPTKNLGAMGDGGMVLTANKAINDKTRQLRNHGCLEKYNSEVPGYNSRLDEVQAAVLRVKLPYLDTWNERRREIASWYGKLLPKGIAPVVKEGVEHVYHAYTIRHYKAKRIAEALRSSGIPYGTYYPIPLHLQSSFKLAGTNNTELTESEKASREVVSLPMYPELKREEVSRIASIVGDAIG